MAFIYHLGAWPGFKYSLGTQLGTEFSLLLSVCPSPLKLLGNARSFFLLQSITDTCLLSEQSCSLQLASQQPEQLGGVNEHLDPIQLFFLHSFIITKN